MRHLKPQSIARAQVLEDEKQDLAGVAFFQIWLAVFTTILTKGFSSQ